MPAYEQLFHQLEKHKLRLRARGSGSHDQPQPGRGSLFYDRRSYTPGDDIRLIDWHAYARTHQPWIKLTQREADERVQVILDTSRSMQLGGKWETAKLIAAGILFLTARQNIPASLILNPAGVEQHGKGYRFLSSSLSLLESITPHDAYQPVIPPRGMITQAYLITDGHIPWHPLPPGTLIIRILNTADTEPTEPIIAEDSETGQRMLLTPIAKREALPKREAAWQKLIQQKHVQGITHHQEEDILKLFQAFCT